MRHTCTSCKLEQLTIKMPSSLDFAPQTQKARGICLLASAYLGVDAAKIYTILKTQRGANEFVWPPKWTEVFARPCPVRPRHGFVDSRPIHSTEELVTVMKETKAADPKGEVLLMPLIDATLNAIWTPSLLTIGKGRDGATAGKNVTLVPLVGKNPISSDLLQKAGIVDGDSPYVEAVYDDTGRARLTQLRAGPPVSSKDDFIPFPVTVSTILVPDGMELLTWEKLIQDNSTKAGVAVNNVGGSPADHYSVHARTFNIPVVTSRQIKLGDELAPTSTVPLSPRAVLDGVIAANEVGLFPDDDDPRHAVHLMLTALHSLNNAEGEQGKWLGMGAGIMLRLGTVALRGEARHIKKQKGDRSVVYRRSLPHSLSRHRASLARLVHVLRYGDFGGGGIGGRKWAECGGSLASLFDAVSRLAKNPDDEAVQELIRAFNSAVNQAHNGGWWMNKFADVTSFNLVQKGLLGYVLPSVPLMRKLDEQYRFITPERRLSLSNRWAAWGPTTLRHDAIKSVNVGVIPGLPGIAFTLQDRVLKDRHRPIIVPAKNVFEKMLAGMGGSLWLVPNDDGLQLDFRGTKETVTLWVEEGVKGGAPSIPAKVEEDDNDAYGESLDEE